MQPTRLNKQELYPGKMPTSVLLRAEQTINFIDEVRGRCMDVGERNPLTIMLEDKFKIKIESTKEDLDREKIKKCDTLFCFEVLEHLYNPLFFLENIRAEIIYLSTPYQYPQTLKGRHHFNEIKTDRLMWLFEEAQLKIIKQNKITISGKWYEHLYGIRPFLRYFQKTRIYKLCKI